MRKGAHPPHQQLLPTGLPPRHGSRANFRSAGSAGGPLSSQVKPLPDLWGPQAAATRAWISRTRVSQGPRNGRPRRAVQPWGGCWSKRQGMRLTTQPPMPPPEGLGTNQLGVPPQLWLDPGGMGPYLRWAPASLANPSGSLVSSPSASQGPTKDAAARSMAHPWNRCGGAERNPPPTAN